MPFEMNRRAFVKGAAACGAAIASIPAALALAEDWPLAAGMSLALSAFNALPALPLDGGRALAAALGEGAAAACSLVTASLCLLAGLILAAEGFGPALPLPGAALLLMQARL